MRYVVVMEGEGCKARTWSHNTNLVGGVTGKAPQGMDLIRFDLGFIYILCVFRVFDYVLESHNQ